MFFFFDTFLFRENCSRLWEPFFFKTKTNPMSTKIDVTGLDRKVLLHELWKNAKPALFFVRLGSSGPEFNMERALSELQSNDTYADYICGRCIKASVFAKENEIDGKFYDREYGTGSFQKVVNRCKSLANEK